MKPPCVALLYVQNFIQQRCTKLRKVIQHKSATQVKLNIGFQPGSKQISAIKNNFCKKNIQSRPNFRWRLPIFLFINRKQTDTKKLVLDI